MQIGRKRKTEDKGHLELTVSKVINGVYDIPRRVSLALLLTMRTCSRWLGHTIRSPSHLIISVTRWIPSHDIVKSFFVLSFFCG